MRSSEFKRSLHLSNTPIYTFDTDESFGRVLRDPMAVLLGRSSLSLQLDSTHTDPYNRVGRFARTR